MEDGIIKSKPHSIYVPQPDGKLKALHIPCHTLEKMLNIIVGNMEDIGMFSGDSGSLSLVDEVSSPYYLIYLPKPDGEIQTILVPRIFVNSLGSGSGSFETVVEEGEPGSSQYYVIHVPLPNGSVQTLSVPGLFLNNLANTNSGNEDGRYYIIYVQLPDGSTKNIKIPSNSLDILQRIISGNQEDAGDVSKFKNGGGGPRGGKENEMGQEEESQYYIVYLTKPDGHVEAILIPRKFINNLGSGTSGNNQAGFDGAAGNGEAGSGQYFIIYVPIPSGGVKTLRVPDLFLYHLINQDSGSGEGQLQVIYMPQRDGGVKTVKIPSNSLDILQRIISGGQEDPTALSMLMSGDGASSLNKDITETNAKESSQFYIIYLTKSDGRYEAILVPRNFINSLGGNISETAADEMFKGAGEEGKTGLDQYYVIYVPLPDGGVKTLRVPDLFLYHLVTQESGNKEGQAQAVYMPLRNGNIKTLTISSYSLDILQNLIMYGNLEGFKGETKTNYNGNGNGNGYNKGNSDDATEIGSSFKGETKTNYNGNGNGYNNGNSDGATEIGSSGDEISIKLHVNGNGNGNGNDNSAGKDDSSSGGMFITFNENSNTQDNDYGAGKDDSSGYHIVYQQQSDGEVEALVVPDTSSKNLESQNVSE